VQLHISNKVVNLNLKTLFKKKERNLLAGQLAPVGSIYEQFNFFPKLIIINIINLKIF